MRFGAYARELLTAGLAVAIALVGTVVALAGRGGEPDFLYRQQHPLRLAARDVERIVRTAPDPATGTGPGGVAASCRAHGSRDLKNPWSCSVRYRSGRRARLRVEIREDGSYVGSYGGGGVARGCCVAVPGAD